MLRAEFCDWSEAEDDRFKYAVVAARYKGKWIFCRHRDRTTWELPGGHREPGETLAEAARRELWEETGAAQASIVPVNAYRVEERGMLYFAEVTRLGPLPDGFEIAELRLCDAPPDALTYPGIHLPLFACVQKWLSEHSPIS